MDNTNNYVAILEESLERKVGLLTELEKCNEEQKKLCKAAEFNIEAYDALVEKKAMIASDLETIDNGFSSVYDRVSDILKQDKSRYAEQIKRMQTLIAKITEQINSIQADEKRIFEMAKDRLGERKKEVAAARKSNQIAANYYKAMSRTTYDPQFMDKKN